MGMVENHPSLSVLVLKRKSKNKFRRVFFSSGDFSLEDGWRGALPPNSYKPP